MTNTLRSERRIEQLRPTIEAAGADVEAIRPALSAPRGAMTRTLDYIDKNHGGVEEFVLHDLGIDPDNVTIFRLNLLV